MPKQIGDYNKNQMLSILRERGPASRVELSRLMNISATAITKNTVRLLKNNIIRECGAERSSMGRKPVLMELCGDFCYVLGADIVGGSVKAALADLMGTVVEYHEEPARREEGAEAVLSQMLSVLRRVIEKSGVQKEKIWVIVVGTSGIFDPDTGKSQISFFLDGWEDIDIRARVFDEFSIEAIIENDVNVDLIGESWKGVGKDYEDILYVKLGQGLASRVVLQNKLLRGNHKIAGEIGYMLPGFPPRNDTNYEKMLCNDAVSKKYRDLGGSGKVGSISQLHMLMEKGDEAARQVIDYLLDNLAVVLLNSTAVLDPQVIILGGDICCFGDNEISSLKNRMKPYFPLEQNIILSGLKSKACICGAIKIGLDRVEERIIDVW